MNCQEFGKILSEIANDRLIDAEARKDAIGHTSACEFCAQSTLNAGLFEFAEATVDGHASPRVKTRLRAAVAERKRTPATPVKPAPAMTVSPSSRSNWALAAAVMIMLLAIPAAVWRHSTRSNGKHAGEENGPLPTKTEPRQMPKLEPAGLENQSYLMAGNAGSEKTGSPRRRVLQRRKTLAASPADEYATEFIPLTMTADPKAIENGTLVRLEVSRAKLIAMGLPIQIEGGREQVNAEVMMGDNGVAYAIRVVR